MNLRWFHVREFQSVRDSGRVTVGDIACLVGKNEAGKTALLRALYKLNPIVAAEGDFDVTRDYPRMEVEDYRIAVEAGRRSHAVPIEACYSIEGEELQGYFEVIRRQMPKKTRIHPIQVIRKQTDV